ncbi:MAG TPA: DUF2249 domain-containing protein [Verrucomicrobiae bacterium]
MTESIIQLDARGLEPPQPMIKILAAVAELAPGTILAAHTDRQPMLLYPQLNQRGLIYETWRQPDGTHLTHIRYR